MSFRPVGSAASTGASTSTSTSQSNPSTSAAAATTGPASASTPTAAYAGPVYPAAASASSYGPQFPAGAASYSSATDSSAAAGYDYNAAYAGYDYSGYSGGYDASAAGSYGSYGGSYASTSSAYPAAAGSFGTTDEELLAQQSAYMPGAAQQQLKVKAQKGQARTTVLRKGAGEVWEDASLMDWDPAHFRLFIGDLGNDVNEDDLVKAFGPEKGWQSFVKAKVVRDKVTNKTRGYGFVSYSDPEDFMKAWKAMNGKYVGSRPVKIQKATTTVRQVDIGAKKARELDTKKKAHTVGNKVRGTIEKSGTWRPYIRR